MYVCLYKTTAVIYMSELEVDYNLQYFVIFSKSQPFAKRFFKLSFYLKFYLQKALWPLLQGSFFTVLGIRKYGE